MFLKRIHEALIINSNIDLDSVNKCSFLFKLASTHPAFAKTEQTTFTAYAANLEKKITFKK
jgi:hypothetical protein